MSHAAIEARHLMLSRIERAAGESFGCAQEAVAATQARFLNGTAVAVATLATAIAATITYLV
ncbi:hypothetical protein [Methylobacterium sp. sgz302541]|uniref:hypothetical protein n=1 Tax=unclassified Methylobacterium TaxID=2615210 RepID=UPI003D334725